MTATKLVLLKLLSCEKQFPQKLVSEDNVIGKSVVVLKLEGDCVSIENSPLIPVSSHQSWTTFQDVSRRMLEAKDVLIFRFEGSSCRPLRSMSTLLKEPSNVLSVTVTQVAKDSVTLSSTSCPDVSKPSKVDFSSLDDVLKRTQELCRSLTSLQGGNGAISSSRVNNDDERTVRSLSTRSVPVAGNSKPSTVLLDECDKEVEHLLKLSESITASEHKDGSSRSCCLPDAPSKIGIIKNFQGGVFIIWDPVKMDGNQRNNGHRVTGYCIVLNGQVVRNTKGPLTCQVEIGGLLPNKNYSVQICTCAEMCNSVYSSPTCFTTRLECQNGKVLPLTRSQSVRSRQSNHSFSASDDDIFSYHTSLARPFSTSLTKRSRSESARPTLQYSSTPLSSRSSSPATGVSFQDEDIQSTSSGTTSGICTDYTMSTKSSLPRSRHASSSPSPLALKTHVYTRPEVNRMKSCSVTEMSVENNSNGKPVPPSRVSVQLNGTVMSVSWNPVRRSSDGTSHGHFVLGYRVYVNDHPVACVDGAASNFVLVDLPSWLSCQSLEVDVRTRTISNESSPSLCALYLSGSDLQQFCTTPINNSSPRCGTCV